MSRNSHGNVISHWPRSLQSLGVILGYIPLSRAVWRFFKPLAFAQAMLWRSADTARRLKLCLTSEDRIQRYRELLEAGHRSDAEGTLISVTVPSRKLGNRECDLKNHLNSFTQMTEHPERFEILVKVDEDDDLSFYYGVKRKFPGLNLRFFVTPRGAGYANLTTYLLFLLDHAAPTSKAWLCTWDDHIYFRKGWDLAVHDLIAQEKLFIVGSAPSDLVGTLRTIPAYPTPVQAYECEPNPIISFSFLEILRSASDGMEGWTPLGDLYIPDGFFPALINLFREKWGVNLYQEIPEWLSHGPRLVSWTKNPKRMAMYYDAFTKFFEPAAMAVRASVAETMYREAGPGYWPEPA